MSRLERQPDRRPSSGRPAADRSAPAPQLVAAALRLVAAAVLIWLVLVVIGHLLGHQWSNSALVRWDASVDR